MRLRCSILQQFDAIYKANNDQIARAKDQIASLSQDQDGLLARRRKHETDQSRLWAMIAFEQVKDRDIAHEPLCRFQLKGATAHSAAEQQVLRAAVLFLRTADAVANEDEDLLEGNQDGVFGDIDTRMKTAWNALRDSFAERR